MSNATYWGVNSIFITLDITNKPKFLTKYKMQEDKNVPVSILTFVFYKQNGILSQVRFLSGQEWEKSFNQIV